MKTLLLITIINSFSSIYASDSMTELDRDFLVQTQDKRQYCSDNSKKCSPLIGINIQYVNKMEDGFVWKNVFKNGILTLVISKNINLLAKQHEFSILKNRLK